MNLRIAILMLIGIYLFFVLKRRHRKKTANHQMKSSTTKKRDTYSERIKGEYIDYEEVN